MFHQDQLRDSSEPAKPLQILTIDGGGLQAISTLLILDKLLETIGKQNGVPHRKQRPCDVFDTIAGIGVGGWLAILLGRFRMDITSCLSEWYKITRCIAPKSKTEALRLRLLEHCCFNTDRLVEQVNILTQVYDTGDCLFEPDPAGARTRHVFVAALASDAKSYKLFRSYEIPKSAKLPKKLLEGPMNPGSFKISSAFGVTGATKYLTHSWKEQIADSGKIVFGDSKFPKPHNITELALDEMWGIYGTDVPLSVVVNIDPGLPSDHDIKQIARRFSWGLLSAVTEHATSTDNAGLPVVEKKTSNELNSNLSSKGGHVDQDTKRFSVHSHEDAAEQNQPSKPMVEVDGNRAIPRTNTLRSIKAREIDANSTRLEDDVEVNIKNKLNNIYPECSRLYYRFAPPKAAQGTSQNDSSQPGVAFNATLDYLSEPRVDTAMDEVVKRMLGSACA